MCQMTSSNPALCQEWDKRHEKNTKEADSSSWILLLPGECNRRRITRLKKALTALSSTPKWLHDESIQMIFWIFHRSWHFCMSFSKWEDRILARYYLLQKTLARNVFVPAEKQSMSLTVTRVSQLRWKKFQLLASVWYLCVCGIWRPLGMNLLVCSGSSRETIKTLYMQE